MPELPELRKEIDAIDDQIISLLKKRLSYVKQVGHLKCSQHKQQMSFLRPGREASMLRDLTEKACDSYPHAAIGAIWRSIISCSLFTERPMTIMPYVQPQNQDCYWLSREYFGSFIPIKPSHSSQHIVASVASDPNIIGVLPPIKSEGHEKWWIRPEQEENAVYIFAKIPFFEDDSLPASALAIACVRTEATAFDKSLISLTLQKGVSPVEIESKFPITYSVLDSSAPHYVIECDGFLEKSATLFQMMTSLDEVLSFRLLGSYAEPLRLK